MASMEMADVLMRRAVSSAAAFATLMLAATIAAATGETTKAPGGYQHPAMVDHGGAFECTDGTVPSHVPTCAGRMEAPSISATVPPAHCQVSGPIVVCVRIGPD